MSLQEAGTSASAERLVNTSAERMVRMSLRPPARLAVGTDFTLWRSRFELYVKQVKLAEDRWVSELLPLLEDELFRIVSQQGLVACTDYKVVIKCLEDFYAPVRNELEWQRRFQGRTQRPQEQLLEFVGALRVLADRAYPKWSAEQRKELLRNQFVQGVRSSSVQLKLMKEMPSTLEDVLTMANQIQTVEEAQKRLQKDRSQMETCELDDSTSNVISGGETNSLEERRLPEQLKWTKAVVQQVKR